jgi:hypothetical protein
VKMVLYAFSTRGGQGYVSGALRGVVSLLHVFGTIASSATRCPLQTSPHLPVCNVLSIVLYKPALPLGR